MLLSARENTWILGLTDYFTRWADALTIPDVSAPLVARALDQTVFFYFELPEQTHTNQGVQLQSQLMGDLCKIWRVNQLDHPISLVRKWSSGTKQPDVRRCPPEHTLRQKSKGMGCGAASDHVDLPQHTTLQHTGDPKHLDARPRNPGFRKPKIYVPGPESPAHEYAGKLIETMEEALQEKQWKVRTEDLE